MGMFDSIYINVKCPNCGETSEMECQTKELECNLNRYKTGDNIGTDQYNYLICHASCHSKTCMKWEQDTYKGSMGGFGYLFHIKVKLNNGIITGEYDNI